MYNFVEGSHSIKKIVQLTSVMKLKSQTFEQCKRNISSSRMLRSVYW